MFLAVLASFTLDDRVISARRDQKTRGNCNLATSIELQRWCRTLLKSYNLSIPVIEDSNFEDAIEAVIQHVAKGDIPRGQYGAIVIDEGHDFQPDWLRLVVDMVDPETKSLLHGGAPPVG